MTDSASGIAGAESPRRRAALAAHGRDLAAAPDAIGSSAAVTSPGPWRTENAPGRTDAGIPKFSFSADWAELVPELNQQPGDCLITKQRLGAFLGTSLDSDLRQRGVTQVLLTGIATSAGVESTARSAYDLGNGPR